MRISDWSSDVCSSDLWGGIIGRRIAQRHSGAVAALHTNIPYAYPPKGAEAPESYKEFRKTGTAYLVLQGTKPDSIAPALSDSPMGLATWILEKFRSEEHTSELQSLMRNSYAVFCLKKK